MVASDDEIVGHLVIEIENKLTNLPQYGEDYKIFKLPRKLRGGGDAFNPQVVSIGPLHHGENRLQNMEKHKERYLSHCLSYNPNITLEGIIRSLNGWEETVRGTYNQKHFPPNFSSEKFVRMMLLDGCFIIQLFLLKWNDDVAEKYDREMFETEFLYKEVQNDLKLVENQLPFFLLQDLFKLITTDEQRGRYTFLDVTTRYFRRYVELGGSVFAESDINHFGDLLLKCFVPSISYEGPPPRSKIFDALPNVSELDKKGVQFKKSDERNLLNIKFINGVLEIPKITITSMVSSTFKNIIAMEQISPHGTNHVTDYMTLMNYLIDTKEDVALLKSFEIIDSYFGEDQSVAELFNNMTGGVIRPSIKHSYYYGMIHQINVYKNNGCYHWKANFKKEYFSSPLKVVSLSAAFIGLVFTVVATLFTVLSFANK